MPARASKSALQQKKKSSRFQRMCFPLVFVAFVGTIMMLNGQYAALVSLRDTANAVSAARNAEAQTVDSSIDTASVDREPSPWTSTSTSLHCRVGKPPWSDLTMEDWESYVRKFVEIWKNSPDKTNTGGGGFFHYFGIFVTIQLLQPTAIVESGAWTGVGTWFLRQSAGPKVKIVVISPNQPTTYVDNVNALYLTQTKFVDFGKTTSLQWAEWVPDVKKTLLFLDDHQAGTKRLMQAKALGFRHLWYDDNYPPIYGDNLALKQICTGMALWNFLGESQAVYKDDFNSVSKPMTPAEFQKQELLFHNNVEVYAEFPPVWRGPSRFPGLNETVIDLVSEKPLLTKAQVQAAGIDDSNIPGWDHETRKYTFVLYVQIKH
eukprot:scaffold12066_cov171-Amphora_coffeaeformis.AAC.4